MKYLTRQEAADELRSSTYKVDRLRYVGVPVRDGVLFLQSFKAGRATGNAEVLIPRQTIEGDHPDRLGFDDLIQAMVRDSAPWSLIARR